MSTLKKIILPLDFCVKCDIINPVVSEKLKKPRAMVNWNTGQRVHSPRRVKAPTIARWSNGKTALCKRAIDGSIPSLASI